MSIGRHTPSMPSGERLFAWVFGYLVRILTKFWQHSCSLIATPSFSRQILGGLADDRRLGVKHEQHVCPWLHELPGRVHEHVDQ